MPNRFFMSPFDPRRWEERRQEGDKLPPFDLDVTMLVHALQEEQFPVSLSTHDSFYVAHNDRVAFTCSVIHDVQDLLMIEVESSGRLVGSLVLVYRKIIDASIPLYLFQEEDLQTIQIFHNSTLQEIVDFLGYK